jgi:peroxidase
MCRINVTCRKTILQAAIFFIFVPVSFIPSIAQQSRAVKGNLLVQVNRLSTDPLSNGLLQRVHVPYRSINGTNNNISSSSKTNWGAAGITLFREMPAQYGPSDPGGALGGVNRPSPRAISNAVIDEPVTQFNTRQLSTLVYQWGQFLDHDMSATPGGTTEYVPIPLPGTEKIFTEAIPFYRSDYQMTTDTRGNQVRQQLNMITSFIDGSNVYGSDTKRATWLRTMRNGKLKTSSGNLLPYNTRNGELSGAIDLNAPEMANDSDHHVKTFVAGDDRAAENPVLTSLHTLFVREHNRICDSLVRLGMRNDEQMYQIARKIVGAEIEAITYQEFLPALGIILQPYSGYKDNVRPDIMNSFATASYRLGHTMVSDDVLLVNNNCEEVGPGEMDLVDVFWNPQLTVTYGIDIFIKGASSHDQYETDTRINDVLRNFLFVSASSPVRFGIDLGSLNIQRGRDHGLPDYNTARLFYTGTQARRFSDITSVDSLADSLQVLYRSVNNVDLWIGVLAEDHLPGKSVGRTLNAMLKSQFEKLRDGDFYFYLNDPYLPNSIRDQIKRTKFSDIIRRNTRLSNIALNAFRTDSCDEEEEITTQAIATEVVPKTAFKIYPNPVRDQLTIDMTGFEKPTSVKIVRSDGVLVKTIVPGDGKQLLQVSTTDLTSGIYMVNITTSKETKSFSFVKL